MAMVSTTRRRWPPPTSAFVIGSGSDVSKETGGIIPVRNDQRDVAAAIRLSKATMGKIKQNLFGPLSTTLTRYSLRRDETEGDGASNPTLDIRQEQHEAEHLDFKQRPVVGTSGTNR